MELVSYCALRCQHRFFEARKCFSKAKKSSPSNLVGKTSTGIACLFLRTCVTFSCTLDLETIRNYDF